jgi:serine protease Do
MNLLRYLVTPFTLLTVGIMADAQPKEVPQPPRGHLGVVIAPSEEGGLGIVVREVAPDSPAAKAGLKKGDRITKLANEEVRDVEKFLQAVAAKKPGDQLELGVLRDGKEENVAVTLGERPAPESIASPGLPGVRRPAFLGVQTMPLTPELKQRLSVDVDAGAVVTEVVSSSPAEKAGLKRDDVITTIDNRPVKTPIELRDAVQQAGPGKEVAIQLARGKEIMTIKAILREGALGYFLTPGEERFPTVDVESMFDQGRRIRELERRIEDLEKRLRELEKK